MLIHRAKLQAGESVLIVGAGGGVNSMAIQIAKLAGATVYALTSTEDKAERARGLGADEVLNYREDPKWSKALYKMTGRRGVDVVVDNVGQATLAQSMRAVARGGRIVVVGNTSHTGFADDWAPERLEQALKVWVERSLFPAATMMSLDVLADSLVAILAAPGYVDDVALMPRTRDPKASA